MAGGMQNDLVILEASVAFSLSKIHMCHMIQQFHSQVFTENK
jgi:hypothetical protein